MELHKDTNGRFTQIFNTSNRYLTAEFPEEPLTELEWFSRMIGKDLNVHKKDDNFWAGHMEKGNPTLNYKPYEVTLPREGRTLDLNNIDDYLAYKVLTTNTHRWIAPSWENRYDRPTYWFAMVDVHPVGGKVAASNPCVKGRAAPAGVAVTVKELVFELLVLFKSVPPLGAEVNAT